MDSLSSDRHDEVPSLLFRVQDRLCALPISHVVETMRPLPIESFAGAPTGVMGLAIIRGAPLPVVKLASLLHSDVTRATRFVTVKKGESQIALVVDSVLGLRNIPESSLRRMPPLLGESNSNAVSAIGILDAEMLLLLNATRLVPDDVWSSLEDATAS